MTGTDSLRPPGWTYNPSSWSERLWLIGVAILGFLISGYLGLYQWGILDSVWEPWFGRGSETVLHSPLSRVLPVPDAILGAMAYGIDAVAGAVGGTTRWKTMPWMVVLFGLAVGPLGLVSVLLVTAQPLLLHAWCTLCLLSAVISVVMIGPAMDEVLASLQVLKRAKEQRKAVWTTFWKGEGKAVWSG
ncbi:MAG: vitamin K epoxide reductase family protein [Nitrospira sp.]|nr:vitamin K epoxide reductase family protein [Nitrospira sp.]MCS6263552.1 vitamin K epoxide reductase family protein [Nitrospira sp.]